MKAIVVDDEFIMLKSFARQTASISEITIVGQFISSSEALEYAKENVVEIAFLDIDMPLLNGIELAKKLREIRKDILIVFITAYSDYLHDFNKIGGDYYLLKPYDKDSLLLMMERINLLATRQEKDVYFRTFGIFNVLKKGKPIHLSGKSKEILAYVAMFRGKEASNFMIYSTIWEGRPYGHSEMTVFFNALRRLRDTLKKEGLSDLLISTQSGLMVNTDLFDCDYYAWLDNNAKKKDQFDGEFLTEYSWAEEKLASLLNDWFNYY